jgi:DNA-binding NarL/FixJ family response regulator
MTSLPEGTHVGRTHLLLADIPHMLDDIIAILADEDRLEVVGHVDRLPELEALVRSTGAEVVLMSEQLDRAVGSAAFLRRHPDVRLLTLSAGGETLRVRELVSRESVIRDVSPRDLLFAILGEPPGQD